MIDLERIGDLCQRLSLGTMATHLPHVAEEAARNELSFQDFFERLLQAEYRERQERSRTQLTRMAGFPAIKTLEQFDFDFATGASKQLSQRAVELSVRRAFGKRRTVRTVGCRKNAPCDRARIQSNAIRNQDPIRFRRGAHVATRDGPSTRKTLTLSPSKHSASTTAHY
jgi:hypothetical protein